MNLLHILECDETCDVTPSQIKIVLAINDIKKAVEKPGVAHLQAYENVTRELVSRGDGDVAIAMGTYYGRKSSVSRHAQRLNPAYHITLETVESMPIPTHFTKTNNEVMY